MKKLRFKIFLVTLLINILLFTGISKPLYGQKQTSTLNMIKLSEWSRGIKLESQSDSNLFAFFWFYEWYLFDAVIKGEHKHGNYNWEWTVDEQCKSAVLNEEWLKLKIHSRENGAELLMEIANNSDHDWPSIAAIIPCFNPGQINETKEQNSLFLDEEHLHTYFLGKKDLELLMGEFPREIHFNHECYSHVTEWEKERQDGKFVFDEKWPTSARNAYAGIIIRESIDKRYVMGIAWESFLSSQGHNPWHCMHLSIKVGPLEQGKKKTIRGKIYLIEGSKEDCLKEFAKDFHYQE
jgi:hypothetical protein